LNKFFNLLSAIEKSLQARKIHAAKNEKITIFQLFLSSFVDNTFEISLCYLY